MTSKKKKSTPTIIKNSEKITKMTLTHKKFANLLVQGSSQVAAYRICYPDVTYETARNKSSKLVAKAHIQEYLSSQQQKIELTTSEKVGINAEWVLTQLKRVVEQSMCAVPFYDNKGKPTGEYRFDSSGANRALDMLGKYLKLWEPDQNKTINVFTIMNQMQKELGIKRLDV